LINIKLGTKKGGGSNKYAATSVAGGGVEEAVGSEGYFKGIFEEVSDDMKAIESDKLGLLLSQLQMPADDDTVTKIMDKYDADGSGEISYTDMLLYYQDNHSNADVSLGDKKEE